MVRSTQYTPLLLVPSPGPHTVPDLLAVVAHDLRQPVSTAIMATEFVEELLEGCGAPEASRDRVRDQLALARRCLHETLRLAEDFLTAAQVDAGALRLRVGAVAVATLLEDLRAAVVHHAGRKGIAVGVETDGAVGEIAGDRERLLQALTNVVGNAVKFTPAGGTVRLSATTAADTVRIAVADSGPGIPAHDVPHVFAPFQQGDGRHGGVGLGLAIATWLVEAHGGHLAVEASGNGGTTVVCTLPTARRAIADVAS